MRERVCEANKALSQAGLAVLTWGNASEADRDTGLLAIKPSGVSYEALTPRDIVLMSIETGEKVDGKLNPSSDTPSHALLYRRFTSIGGIVHTHSTYATAWAQARRPIPCLGTTHADHFHGTVPCTRALTREEVRADYELNTGKVIAEHFDAERLDPVQMPAVLVAGHGPFVWGGNAAGAVNCGITLEEVARMAARTLALDADAEAVEEYILEKHYLRKHGAEAYYGQE